jgi:hypothetical protein
MTSYATQFDCNVRNVTKDVCICPKGRGDYLCATAEDFKCYINMTDPALYEGCADKFEDSAYYLYSIPGFSPCFWFDFDTVVPMKYMLKCMANDANMINEEEVTGYEYRDVVSPPEYNPF